jgi:hypothetical protein
VSTRNFITENKTLSAARRTPQQPCTSQGTAEQTSAHKEGFRQRFLSAAYYQLLVWLYPHPLLRAVLLEFRSLILRIQILRKTKLHLAGSLRNPRLFLHATEYPPSCECELACIRDTRLMLAKHPWATALDQALFWEGWDMGAISHHCRGGSSCCCNRETGNTA